MALWRAVKSFVAMNWLQLAQWLGLVAAVAGMYLSIRKGGADAERAEQQGRILHRAADANEARRDIERMGADARRQRLYDKWRRD